MLVSAGACRAGRLWWVCQCGCLQMSEEGIVCVCEPIPAEESAGHWSWESRCSYTPRGGYGDGIAVTQEGLSCVVVMLGQTMQSWDM